MEQSENAASIERRTALESRINETPQSVPEYLRLARLLEAEGDAKGAAAALVKAHFFLPNGPTIISELRRLSRWVESAQAPVTITRPAPSETPEPVSEVGPPESVQEPEPEPQRDDLDQLIAGLEKGRMDPNLEPAGNLEPEWSDDDGLIATETLAQIYVAQKQFQEAVLVYERLASSEENPEKVAALRDKAAGLRKKLRDSG